MEDEYADRVYVPGTNATPPPARDVEPFWPPEELEAPVHGGRPVPHEPGPAVPVQGHQQFGPHQNGSQQLGAQHFGPQSPAPHSAFPHHPPLTPAPPPAPLTPPPAPADEPVLYRPADRGTGPQPLSPQPVPQPAPVALRRPTVQPPPNPPPRAVLDPSTQAWPNIKPRDAAEAQHNPAVPATPESTQSGPPTADTPWSLPPQPRPAPTDAQYDDVDIKPLGDRDRGIGQYPVARQRSDAQHGADVPHGADGRHGPDAQHRPPQQRTGSAGTEAPQPAPRPQQPGPAAHPLTADPLTAERATYYPTVTPRRAPDPQDQHTRPDGPPVPPAPVNAHGAQPPHNPYDHGPPVHPQQTAGPYPPAIDPGNGVHPGPQHPAPHPHPQAGQPDPACPPHVMPAPHVQDQPRPQPPHDPYHQVPWASDGTAPTAEEFARRRLARPAEPVATMGPRALLQKGTMGLVKLPPGRRELEYKQDVEMVRRNFGGLRQVTVVNPKGGAGKTVAVLLLAMTFGQKRGGYVLAWDNNETQGTLGMRAQQDFHARTVRDMMRDLDLFRGSQGRVGDLSQYVRAQGEGMFDVLASDESATAGEMLTANAFGEIREIVSRFYKLIFVDTGNNVRAQNWQAAMDATDQLVITMSARNDSAETAARMLDHLEQSGRQRLVRQAISIVSMPPTRKDIDLPAIQRHFAARTRAVLISPYEKLIDSGEPLRYAQLSSETKNAWLKIAAAVAEGL